METGHVILAIFVLFGHEKFPKYACIVHQIYFIVLNKKSKSLHFFHVMTLASRCKRIVLLSCIHVPMNRRMNMAYFSNLTKIGNSVILNIFGAKYQKMWGVLLH